MDRPIVGSRSRRALATRLQLLCECDAGLEATAPMVAIAVRDLVGAASTSIFWNDRSGAPGGFFHDCAPAELKDLFVSRLDDLFARPDEPNMRTLIEAKGPPIGGLLEPATARAAARTNVWKYLSLPLDHYWCFDIRIERHGRGSAALCLWNPERLPFTRDQVRLVEDVWPMLCQAAESDGASGQWQPADIGAAHLVTSIDGSALLAIDAQAEAVLSRAHLLRQNIPLASPMRDAPTFCRELAVAASRGERAGIVIPCAEGRLRLEASASRRLSRTGASRDEQELVVTVTLERPRIVGAIGLLDGLELTPLQKRIALFAMKGGLRTDCGSLFAVSQEALKKHLRQIYHATGARDWAELSTRMAH